MYNHENQHVHRSGMDFTSSYFLNDFVLFFVDNFRIPILFHIAVIPMSQ